MAFKHGKDSRVFLNGYELTSFLRKVTTPGEVAVADSTTMGKASKTYIAGQGDAKLSAEGLFSADSVGLDDIDDLFKAALESASAAVWLYLPEGDGVGKRAVAVKGPETSHEVDSPVDGIVSVKADCQSSIGIGGGTVYFDGVARTAATANSASTDDAAASSRGGVLAVQVIAGSGADPLTVKAQDSVDNAVWVDIAGAVVTPNADAGSAAAVEFSGNVNRYLRATYTKPNGVDSCTFIAAIARR